MPWPKGKARAGTGTGRKKGVAKRLRDEAALSFKLIGKSPAEFLDDKMNNSLDEAVQLEAAKALMSYCHRKQPEERIIDQTNHYDGEDIVRLRPGGK